MRAGRRQVRGARKDLEILCDGDLYALDADERYVGSLGQFADNRRRGPGVRDLCGPFLVFGEGQFARTGRFWWWTWMKALAKLKDIG